MRFFLNQRKRAQGMTVGVAFGGDGVALAAVRSGGRDGMPRLVQAGHVPATGSGALATRIGQWVEEAGLTKIRGVGVIANADYQTLQVEAPPVPAAELRQAAGWRVRELIDFPLDQALIDTFAPPESAQRGQDNVNVVVARRARVSERIEQLREAGLALEAIDIPELCQRNLSARLPEARGGHALLALGAADGLITVYRDGELFLARGLDTGLNTLAERPQDCGEALLLEIQRSFDYFESALSQPPLGALYVYPACESVDGLVQQFADNLGNVSTRALGLADLVTVECALPGGNATLAHAVGAALRDSVEN